MNNKLKIDLNQPIKRKLKSNDIVVYQLYEHNIRIMLAYRFVNIMGFNMFQIKLYPNDV